MRALLPLLAALLLSACAVKPATPVEIVRYDLGEPARGMALAVPIALVTVSAPGWLDSAAQSYRLEYDNDLQRQAYAHSRWVAPAPELLERFLQRRMLVDPDGRAGGCRLAISLDELEQRFSAASTSRVVLEARVRLLAPTGSAELSRRGFLLARESLTPDARGGTAAVRAAAESLADALGHWLEALARQKPEVLQRCHPNPEK